MKVGANSADQAKIKKLFAAEKTAAQISKALGIDLACVKSFDPKAKK